MKKIPRRKTPTVRLTRLRNALTCALVVGCAPAAVREEPTAEETTWLVAGQSNARRELAAAIADRCGEVVLVRHGATALASFHDEYYDELAQASSVAGIAWVHGEGDSNQAARAEVYGTELIRLVERLWADWGTERTRVAVALVHYDQDRPHQHRVRSEQAMAAARLGGCAVSADDLRLGPDGIHYEAAEAHELGERLAEALCGKELW